MSKKGKFAAVYKKTSKEFKRPHLTFDNQNHKEGWAQREVNTLTEAAAKSTGRVGSGKEVKGESPKGN
jgi:hypothetical protein